jgi:hypothetical protein
MYDNRPGSKSRGLFCTGTLTGTCWWESASSLNAIIDYSEQTGSTKYLHDITNTFRYAPREEIHSLGPFLDRYFDDDVWWGLTWVNAYRLTGNRSYLRLAESIFTYTKNNGWSNSCKGGIWQFAGPGQNGQPATKDVGVNAQYITLGARLYQATKNRAYLDGPSGAVATTRWLLNNNFIIAGGAQKYLVRGFLTQPNCAFRHGRNQSNYQGMAIGALTSMYRVTHNHSYLVMAQHIANAVLVDTQASKSSLPLIDKNDVLTETCPGAPYGCNQSPGKSYLQYKGVFMRNLYCLNSVASSVAYGNFFAHNAAWITKTYHRSGKKELFGFTWDHYSVHGLKQATQGSALDALNASMGGSNLMCSG